MANDEARMAKEARRPNADWLASHPSRVVGLRVLWFVRDLRCPILDRQSRNPAKVAEISRQQPPTVRQHDGGNTQVKRTHPEPHRLQTLELRGGAVVEFQHRDVAVAVEMSPEPTVGFDLLRNCASPRQKRQPPAGLLFVGDDSRGSVLRGDLVEPNAKPLGFVATSPLEQTEVIGVEHDHSLPFVSWLASVEMTPAIYARVPWLPRTWGRLQMRRTRSSRGHRRLLWHHRSSAQAAGLTAPPAIQGPRRALQELDWTSPRSFHGLSIPD